MTQDNVIKFAQPGTFRDPLTEILRNGARALLAHAVEAEVAGFLGDHADKLTADGRARLVRHGHLPEREIVTGTVKHQRILAKRLAAEVLEVRIERARSFSSFNGF